MDEEIEDEDSRASAPGYLFTLAQDAGDDGEGAIQACISECESLRLVLKAHHKEYGTFPLCQIPGGFFPDRR